MRRSRWIGAAVAALALIGWSAPMATAQSSPQSATYTAIITVPVPPASSFTGAGGGGDGWAVALTPTALYNVFHHSGQLYVMCHLQANASDCWNSSDTSTGADYKHITETVGSTTYEFLTSGQPGMWMNQGTGKLYVYATRNDGTAGVVCIDTTKPASVADPICTGSAAFTALSPVGEAATYAGISDVSDPVQVGTKLYAFNYVNTDGSPTGAEDKLLCFDQVSLGPCASQPFTVNYGTGTPSTPDFPAPSIAPVGNDIFVPMSSPEGPETLACLNASTGGNCAGSWPVNITTTSYVGSAGAAFPLLNSSGSPIGVCLPIGSIPCYNLNGSGATTPSGLPGVVTPNTQTWNGPAMTIGPRVYVPNRSAPSPGDSGAIQCFDYSTGKGCAGFPKTFNNMEGLYTVNPDPQRPSCIWVNADGGTDQIQNFDAFTGGPCGQGATRVLASSVVAPQQQCIPFSFSSLQVLQPTPGQYTSGTVDFEDVDGNPISNVPQQTLDSTGTVQLSHFNLKTNGLPQFLLTFNGLKGNLGKVVLKLTWTGVAAAGCAGPNTVEVAGGQGIGNGLMLLAGDGGMFAFGSRSFVGAEDFGGLPGPLTTPSSFAVIPDTFAGIAGTPGGKGYFNVLQDGKVFTVGNAVYHGGADTPAGRGGAPSLTSPIVGIAATPDGGGYWLVQANGGVFSYGDAAFYGSLAGKPLNQPIIGIMATPSGKGYWLYASDGGVFAFGDARYFGSRANQPLNAPVVGMTPTSNGQGYLLAGADGGVFTYGDAIFKGSLVGSGIHLRKPIVAIGLDQSGEGYWLIAGDGGIFPQGDAPFQGSVPMYKPDLRSPIVGAVG